MSAYLDSGFEEPKKPFAHLQTFTPSAADQSLFGFNKPSSTDIRDRRFVYGILFLQLFLIITMVVDVVLDSWVSYCNLTAGMTRYAKNGKLTSFRRFEDDYCDSGTDYVGSHCGDVCSNTRKLKHGGVAMMALGIPSMVLLALACFRMFLLLVHPNREFGNVFIRVLIVASSATWIAGMVVYGVQYGAVSNDASKTQVEEGFILSVIIAAWQLAMCVLENVALSKILRQPR